MVLALNLVHGATSLVVLVGLHPHHRFQHARALSLFAHKGDIVHANHHIFGNDTVGDQFL